MESHIERAVLCDRREMSDGIYDPRQSRQQKARQRRTDKMEQTPTSSKPQRRLEKTEMNMANASAAQRQMAKDRKRLPQENILPLKLSSGIDDS